MTRLAFSAFVSAFAGLTAFAGRTLTWNGAASGTFSAVGAWKTSGGATAVPAAGDSLVIPSGEVIVTSADAAAFRSAETKVNIAEGAKLNVKGVTATFELVAVLSGRGVVAVTDSVDKWVRFKSDNSAFTGTFEFKNSTVCVDHAKALGVECPVTGTGPSSGGAWFCLNGIDGATLANPMTLTSRNYFTFANYGCLVTFTGAITLNGFTRFQSGNEAANTRYVFEGPLTVNGILDPYLQPFATKNNYLVFSQTTPLDMNIHAFGYDGTAQRVVFNCPVTGFANATAGGDTFLKISNGSEYVFNADIVGSDAAGLSVQFVKGTMDLSGHTVKVGNLWHTQSFFSLYADDPKVITASEKPGTLIVSAMVARGGTATFDGRLRGHVTFDYDSAFDGNSAEGKTACWFIKFRNKAGEASDTDGDLVATRGWIELLKGARFTRLGNLVCKDAGRITVNAGVAVCPTANVRVYGKGKLELAKGADLVVNRVWTYPSDGSADAQPVRAGRYAAVADPAKGIKALPCLAGEGVLTVTEPKPGFVVSIRGAAAGADPGADPTPHALSKAPGGVSVEGAPLAFDLFNVPGDIAVGYRIVDWRDQELLRGVWPANRVLTVPALPRGYYRIEIDGDVARGTSFAVVGDPSAMESPSSSFYGTDAAFSWCASQFNCPWKGGNTREVVADLMQLAGLKHVRERLQWQSSQWNAYGPATFDGNEHARNILFRHGFVVLDYFNGAAPHLRITPSNDSSMPKDLGAAYDFAKKSAQAFEPTMDAWEFYNEPEGAVPEPVWDYVSAMKAGALGYRAGHPGATLLNGPLTSVNRLRYTEEVFSGEVWKYLNAFSIHYYDQPSGCEGVFAQVREYLKRHSLDGAAIFVTECGSNLEGRSLIPAPPPWEDCKMHSRDQEMVLMEFYPKSQIFMQMSGVSRNYFFNFCAFNEGGADKSKDWGVMRRDGTVKPIFAAMAAMTRALETSTIVGEMASPGQGVRVFLFERGNGEQTIAYFTSTSVDAGGPDEIVYGQDKLVPFSLPVSRGSRYVTTDPVGRVEVVTAETGSLALVASRHTAYVSGFRGLKAERPAAPRGRILRYQPSADEDLSVVFKIELNTNDFAVVAEKSVAELRAALGRVKVTAWNLDDAAKRGTVRAKGAKLVGIPDELALPAFGSASFEATLEPDGTGALDTRLVIDGTFEGRRTTPLEMPVFFEHQFLGSAERIELKGSRDVSLWRAYGSQRDFSCTWDEAEQAIRMDLAWDFATADRWFFPRMSLGEGESLEDAKYIEFEVKSEQDKVENDYSVLYAQFNGGWVSYEPPLLTWESRRISLSGVQDLKSSKTIGFGGLPRGYRVTYWIRNIRMLKEKK